MTRPAEQPSFDDLRAALDDSHDRLVAALSPLDPEQVAAPSYDDGWTIAQVASHLGSGAEIFALFLEAGVAHTPAPGADAFGPVWDQWNAKTATAQAADAVIADAAFLDRLDTLSADEQQQWRLDMFGSEQNLTGLLQMRLGEHALHTWDIVVALDAHARVSAAATRLLIDAVAGIVDRAGKPATSPRRVHVTTTDPERAFHLDIDSDGARLSPTDAGGDDGDGRLQLPAEAFIRLVYGRLDPAHTPAAAVADGVSLDELRSTFPGI
ncbi:MAG TPA: maleylpyruvate isomerase family mycothiol-dependent enzyme [Jatrophihabitantaceae bacterium]|nr:maleylpyruvate isomerase family mycothiol-dependent enzyme [Jatrophihabitantaceae bacterium]